METTKATKVRNYRHITLRVEREAPSYTILEPMWGMGKEGEVKRRMKREEIQLQLA